LSTSLFEINFVLVVTIVLVELILLFFEFTILNNHTLFRSV